MCGITGYVGARPAGDVVLRSLERLEYRGYDSAGIAWLDERGVRTSRAAGPIANLVAGLPGGPEAARVAIAHTRWATHGAPTERNAHPHADCTGAIALVHNGIVENYAELRDELRSAGHEFASDTDTEVLAHLIEEELNAPGMCPHDVAEAMRRALRRVRGSYALAVVSPLLGESVLVARQDSPLVIGRAESGNLVASDIAAVLPVTRRVIVMENGDAAMVGRDSVRVFRLSDGSAVERGVTEVTWDADAAEKGGFEHFMRKEIHEEPRVAADALRGRLAADGRIDLGPAPWRGEWSRPPAHACIVGCGTAYHAGLVGKRLLEAAVGAPVEAWVASEYRYGDPVVGPESLVIAVSQSGETADTLAALRQARAAGASTVGIVNVVGSSLAREADAVLHTHAGPEIGVASTKAYLAQVISLSLLAARIAQARGVELPGLPDGLRALPGALGAALRAEKRTEALGARLQRASCFFFLGRGLDYAAAREGALKLKEISYVHAEAYAAGEMKHGPLALVEPGVAVVGLCTQARTHEKMVSNLQEVSARGGTVVAVVRRGLEAPPCADEVLWLPEAPDAVMPGLAMLPLQLLAYHIARLRGCSIDRPRNLAKSVTVE